MKPITDESQLKTCYYLGRDFWPCLKASLDCSGWNSEDTHLKIICAPVLLERDWRTSHCFCLEENVVGDSSLWLCVTWDQLHMTRSLLGQLLSLPKTRCLQEVAHNVNTRTWCVIPWEHLRVIFACGISTQRENFKWSSKVLPPTVNILF